MPHPDGLESAALGTTDLAKPILFECDYEYQPDEDARLTVKWFKDKEAEPFYQWLPELNVRHFADWFRPLVDQTFVADARDPMKRFRSLLIRRLSMNLTGQYTCLVSSLANQDSRSGTLALYQPPHSFVFEHRIYPAPASLVATPQAAAAAAAMPSATPLVHPTHAEQPHRQPQQYPSRARPATPEEPLMRPPPASAISGVASPTQFKGLPIPFQWPQGVASLQQQQQQQQLQQHPQAIKPPFVAAGQANHQLPPPAAAATIVRPANNNSQNQSLTQTTPGVNGGGEQADASSTKIVYTHDGRPIRRKLRRRRQAAPPDASDLQRAVWQQHQQQQQAAAQITSWQLRKRLGDFDPSDVGAPNATSHMSGAANYAIQLHHFVCQATQLTPRPLMALLVKRGPDSIAQYLHESSLISIRPYQVNQSELFPSPLTAPSPSGCGLPAAFVQERAAQGELPPIRPMLVTLFDITVSATVALNVSLPQPQPASNQPQRPAQFNQFSQMNEAASLVGPQHVGVSTILNYRRGQRMSFECHLELTGTEFEARKRIGINEEEVYQFAEAEEQRHRLRLQQMHELQLRQRHHHQQQSHQQNSERSGSSLLLGFGAPGSSAGGSLRTLELASLFIAAAASLLASAALLHDAQPPRRLGVAHTLARPAQQSPVRVLIR